VTRKSKPAGLLRFASFRLDAVNACLWRGTKTIRLTPKAFAVLQYLVERPGELVTKDALLEAVWPATVVGDAVLKVCVREIRKALGDPAGTPRYIATVHRLGYRFIAGVADGAEQRRARDEPAALSPADPTPARHVRSEGAGHLVGRDRALDRLQMWLDAAWRGRRQVAFLTGEAGVGKTAVVDAFLERVAADPRVWIAQGQCVETYGTSEPYLPVLDALARLCRGSAADRLVPLLRRHAPTWLVEMPWLLDSGDRDTLQRELIGATRERMLREMAELVEALTTHAPLVLVLEDLHWSDAATVDLLSLIARRREPARLLLIATYRPVEATLTESPVLELTRELEARGRAQSLALALLGAPSVADYLRERFPGNAFPAELAHVIHARTEGNPLFMVTLVDDLLARGLIAPREHGWELRAALDAVDLDVPESLRQMIDRQIGRVGKEEQHMLEAGSVAGMEFSAVSVAAAMEQPVADVEERCDELVRGQLFLRSLGAREWPDRTVATRYAFVHALHRNTLYQRISPGRRRELHQSIGEREETGYGDRARDIAAELAAHFEPAGDDTRAVRYLAQAARRPCGGMPTARRSAISRGRGTSPPGFPSPRASPRSSHSSSRSASPAARWATCPPPSRPSPPWPATRASTAKPPRRSARSCIWPARCPGSTGTGAWRPESTRSSSPTACTTTRCRRMSAATAACSASCPAAGGTRTRRRVTEPSTSRAERETSPG